VTETWSPDLSAPTTPTVATSRPSAVLCACIIGGLYLTMFGAAIVRSVKIVGHRYPLDDYSSTDFQSRMPFWMGSTLLATGLLYLVSRQLGISAAEAGLARRGASRIPTLYAVVSCAGALIAAGLVLRGVQSPGADAYTGTVNNAWAVPGLLLRCVNAGVVEEITVVAIPFLLCTRRGWNTRSIILLCAVLRWPYHLYHGWGSVPWALIWGAVFAAVYIIWRRLLAVVVLHVVFDLGVTMMGLYGGSTGLWIMAGVYFIGFGALVTAVFMQIRGARMPGMLIGQQPKDVRTYLARSDRLNYIIWPACCALTCTAGAVTVIIIGAQTLAGWGLTLCVGLTLILTPGLIFVAGFLPAYHELIMCNIDVQRDSAGRIVRVVSWRLTHHGAVVRVGTAGDPTFPAVMEQLRMYGHFVVVHARPRTATGKALTAMGYPPTRSRRLGRRQVGRYTSALPPLTCTDPATP